MKTILGIDIGTTSVCALVLDADRGETVKSVTLPNDSFIKGEKVFEKIQNPAKIIETVKKAIAELPIAEIVSVGVTGQMHGIVYLDENNQPVSNLAIWQDERGNEIFENGKTYAQVLTELTGYKMATGYGLCTHFYNLKNGLVPKNAVKLSTIHDYLVSVLTGSAPVTHSSDAASLGLFDLDNLCFDEVALNKAGIDKSILPEVKKNTSLAGKTACDFLPQGLPVAVAIGDNQASFLGSVKSPEKSVLVNVGTGSQVSFLTSKTKTATGEIRPLTDDKYIYVGASLCGGRAYQILKNFFVGCAEMLGGDTEDMYEKMNALSEDIFDLKDAITVNCEFCGTREDPTKRGFIAGLSADNFTPKHFVCGVLKGVCEELYGMYQKAGDVLEFTPEILTGSGNGLRKSRIWREIFSNAFGLPLVVPKASEEAAVGACVFSAAASGMFDSVFASQQKLL